MINSVVLVGRLTRDPELRYTGQNNTPVTTITVAVDRNYQNAQGQRDADFINVVIWRKPAEIVSQYFRKGSRIGITGRLQTRNYQDQSGQTRYVTEVVASDFSFIDSRAESEARGIHAGGGMSQQQPHTQNNYTNNTPPSYQNTGNQTQNFGRDDDPFKDTPIDISDDDLPF